MPDPTDDGHPVALIEASHHLAQFLADEQLSLLEGPGRRHSRSTCRSAATPAATRRGPTRDLFAPAMAIGAPPDALFKDGQNWGFPPQLPGEAERSRIRSVADAGRELRAVLVDAPHRPRPRAPPPVVGARRNVAPSTACTSAIPATRCWLGDRRRGGDVEHNRRRREPRHGAAGDLRPAGASGRCSACTPSACSSTDRPTAQRARWFAAIPAGTVACVRTHDMEALAALYDDGELGGVPQGGRGVPRSSRPRHARRTARRRPRRLAASPTRTSPIADLDDLVGETTPHNVPGKVLPTFWRRRLAEPTSETLADPRVRVTPGHTDRTSDGTDASRRDHRVLPAKSTCTCSTRAPIGTCTTCLGAHPIAGGGTWFAVWAPARDTRRRASATSPAGRRPCRWSRSGCRASGPAQSPTRRSATATGTGSRPPTATRPSAPIPWRRPTSSRHRRRR